MARHIYTDEERSQGRPVVVLAGGSLTGVEQQDLPPDAYVIAADSGWWHAKALGIEVNLLIGDLDSIGDSEIELIDRGTVQVERAPTEKDETDLELALARALPIASEIVIAGALGGRFDHILGNLAAACSPQLAAIPTSIVTGNESIHVVWDRINMQGTPGELVSLVPWGGPVRGVTISGLQYRPEGGIFEPGRALGISNVFVNRDATVVLEEGTLLVVRTRSE